MIRMVKNRISMRIIDDIDVEIIQVVSEYPGLCVKDLSKHLTIPYTTLLHRVKTLAETQFIRLELTRTQIHVHPIKFVSDVRASV